MGVFSVIEQTAGESILKLVLHRSSFGPKGEEPLGGRHYFMTTLSSQADQDQEIKIRLSYVLGNRNVPRVSNAYGSASRRQQIAVVCLLVQSSEVLNYAFMVDPRIKGKNIVRMLEEIEKTRTGVP